MSDQIIINITQDPSVNLSVINNTEEITLDALTLNQGLINHSTTHQKNGSDELSHNLLGGMDGGQSGQYYHLTTNQYNNNVYYYDSPVFQTGNQTISGEKILINNAFFSGNVSVNQSSPQNRFEVSGKSYLGTFKTRPVLAGNQDTTITSYTQSASNNYSLFTNIEAEPTANNSALYYSLYSNALLNGTGNISRLVAFQGQVTHSSPSIITQARGMAAVVQNSSSGTITNAYGSLSAILNTSDGTITNAFAAYAQNVANTGPITNKAGIVIDNVTNGSNNTNLLIGTSTVPSGNYSICNTSTYNSVFSGNIGIGTSSPSSKISILDNNFTTELGYSSSASANGVTLYGSQPATYGKTFFGCDAFGNSYIKHGNSNIFEAAAFYDTAIKGNVSYVRAGNSKVDIGSPYERILMDSYGANAIQFFAGSNERVRINNLGRVGIGTSSPATDIDIARTWNSAATVFTGVRLNITDTASNASSSLVDLQAGGISKISIIKDGEIRLQSKFSLTNSNCIKIKSDLTNNAFILNGGNGVGQFMFTSADGNWDVVIGGGLSLAFSNVGAGFVATPDLRLYREGTGILAQRNSNAAQTFRLYNTYTDGSNYERGFFRWTSNVLEIGAEGIGTGSNRNLSLLTAGSSRLRIDSAGNISLGDNIRTDLTLLDIIVRGDGDAIRLYSANNTAGGSVNPPSISFYRSIIGPSVSARFKITGHNGSDFSGFAFTSPDISIDWIRASSNLNDLGLGGTGNVIASYQRHYFYNSIVIGKDNPASTAPEGGTIRSGQKVNNATNIAGSNLTLQAGAGTGNSTTNGSIILQTPDSTVSGTDIQLYSTKFILSRFGNVGIGTVSPQLKLHISADSGSTYSWGEGIQVSAFNNNANFRPFVGFYRARGTEASPLDIAANDVIGSFSFISRVSGQPTYTTTIRSVAKDTSGNGRWEVYNLVSGSEQLGIALDGLNLAFGGYTSSFPAIKRSSAILQARLADDSGYTTIDAQHRLQGAIPTSATDTGTAGDIRYDANYIYICTATNTWKRVAISTWP